MAFDSFVVFFTEQITTENKQNMAGTTFKKTFFKYDSINYYNSSKR